MRARERVAVLEAELAKAKAEIETWKEAHAALARAIQPPIVNVPFVYTPPVYVPPYQAPALPWFEITCGTGAQQ